MSIPEEVRLATNHCLTASALLQDGARDRVYQHRESVVQLIGIHVHQDRAFAFNSTSKHAPQTEQGAAAADLAPVTRAVADHFTVRAQHGFQQGKRIELAAPLVVFIHGRVSLH